MPTTPEFSTASTTVALEPAPIAPGWIREGAPVARAAEISCSPDDIARTVVWDCTAGKFEWTYYSDETIHILEGSIILQDGGHPPTVLGPGDVVFFPKGSKVTWEVVGYVKKLAFFRSVVPNPWLGPYRALRRLRSLARGERREPSISVMK